jgi:glycine/D-amino acid oxidase-like deaminating enzyme/nitrite reductase/ring-hydroxylating ferredoxin subunit
MKRDGATTSLWQHNIPDFTTAAATIPDQLLDVVIVGGGITGITTALQLQLAGKKCLVAEAHTLCFGTTGGTTAHLNTFFDNDYKTIIQDFGEESAQLVARATRQALNLVKHNVETYNIDCGYAEKDGYVYAQNADQQKQLSGIMDASLKAGVAVAFSASIPVPVPFEKAIVYKGQAQIHPTQYVLALAKAFEQAGGIILQHCHVTEVADKEPLVIQTSLGEIKAHKLIYATHIPPGINLLHFRNAPYRSYAMAVTLQDGAYPDGLAYDMYDPYHYYRTQEVDGQQYLIAGGEDHKTAHVVNTEACFDHLESYLRTHFKVDQIAYKWSSQYFEPSDGLAYIGQLPQHSSNMLVATGFGGNGITYSHIAAITLTDLIVKGESELAKLFAPSRLKPVAGFEAFVKENADVVKEFIGKRIGVEQLEELAGLAPGEAKVVKFEGKQLAIYKGENGSVHALSPVCSHAKCIVDWNRAEKTWDCPCHGARYSIEGEVLTGPARHALEKVELSDLIDKK